MIFKLNFSWMYQQFTKDSFENFLKMSVQRCTDQFLILEVELIHDFFAVLSDTVF
jgi:hypothetical protein